MSQQLLVLALVALLVFWMLGAYNRLVELRNAIGVAGATLDEALRRRASSVEPLVETLRAQWPDETGTLEAVLAAQLQSRSAADALRQYPAQAPRALAYAQTEATLTAALARLLALLEHRPEAAAQPDVAPQLAALREAAPRLVFARQLYNDAAQAYNEAARQFPTNLLARLFGFGAAGTL